MLKLSRGHDRIYDSKKYVEYAKQSNLTYFLGNGENPAEQWSMVDDILYFPSAFWLNRNYRADKFTVDWLIDECNNRDIVVLIHPEDIISGTRLLITEYERMLDNVESFKTITDILDR